MLSKQVASVVFEELGWYDHVLKYLLLCELQLIEFAEGNWCYDKICQIIGTFNCLFEM